MTVYSLCKHLHWFSEDPVDCYSLHISVLPEFRHIPAHKHICLSSLKIHVLPISLASWDPAGTDDYAPAVGLFMQQLV